MDAEYKRRLQQHYEAINRDLDISDIQDVLYQENYFSTEEYERVVSNTKIHRRDRTRDFLDRLMQTGNNEKYQIFVDSLAKYYYWLWEKLKMESKTTDLNESSEDSLSKGDVPRLPDHHVNRVALEATVVEKLKQVTRHKIVALYGMSGSGKTCVAIGALRGSQSSELVTDYFNGVVLWINLGNCKTDDEIIAQQTKLLRKTAIYNINSSVMIMSQSMSSIGSNGDSLSLSNYDLSSQDLRDKLKTQFSTPSLKECLLVLDEVNDRKCLEAFDIGCKILLTTRDKAVFTNYKPQVVTVENSFEKSESLKLFASFLNEPVSKLPRQAKKLHEICKGSPFHIALVGAQLAENKQRLKDSPRQWDIFVRKLEKKDFSFFFSKPDYDPIKAIEMSINSLDDNLRQLFMKLAILPDNVNVSAKVVGKLWNVREHVVSSYMLQLKSKSLINAHYDTETSNDLYEVHDLIAGYLRKCFSPEDTIKLHSKLLDSYGYCNDQAPVEIVDDGYIAFYVGYHIEKTQDKLKLFKKLFLDLKFLGNKVRLTGPADVILDLQKYERYIVNNDHERELVNSISMHLMTHGSDLHRYQCTDIVQSILQHETEGSLYNKAWHIAQLNCQNKELYFEFVHEQNEEGIKHSTIDVKEDITCVCFLRDFVLVGTQTGVVKFFHNPTNKFKKELSDQDASHGTAVKWIGVAIEPNPRYPIVAVLYYNGTVKLWNIDDLDTSDSEEIIEEEPEELHNNNLRGNVTISPNNLDSVILNCRWSFGEDFLITHTDRKIVTYSHAGEVLSEINIFDSHTVLVSCVPCITDRHDSYVAVATSGPRQCIEVIDLETRHRVMTFEGDLDMDHIIDLLALPGSNKILALTSSEVIQYSFTILYSGTNNLESKPIISSKDIKSTLSFRSFVVNKTGSLLFVATDDRTVACVDLKTLTHVFDLDNMRGDVVAMAVSEILMWDEFIPGYDVLLTGTGTVENTAKVWHLDTSYISHAANKNGRVRLTTRFDVSFLDTASPASPTTPPIIKDTASPKRHQSFNQNKEIPKRSLQNTMSLDRGVFKVKPLNLKGLCFNDSTVQPLLAVIDDRNSIQLMRGRKILTEISEKDSITTVKVSPCNQHVVYGMKCGIVKRYTMRTKESAIIIHVSSSVQYLKFVNSNLLVVASENMCIMAHTLMETGAWESFMLHKGNTYLGSQEILNDLQGVKKKQSDSLSISESHVSLDSRHESHRTFPNGERKSNLSRRSDLVDCFWISDIGMVTVESNSCVKLWSKDMKLGLVLHARRDVANVTCAAFSKNVLVICDNSMFMFQTFILENVHNGESLSLKVSSTHTQKLNSAITCCDLTADGNLLALGLDSGNVVVWNVKRHRQINGLLQYHKNKVQNCAFSPVPDRLYSNLGWNNTAEEEPPLVLVTMATEIVWWNITYFTRRANGKNNRSGFKYNALTPLSPSSPLTLSEEPSFENANPSQSQNVFFAEGFLNQNCWKDLWKGKTCKQGSKRKEMLACIKLSGTSARRLYSDNRFSRFVTVDNSGHVYIMNVLKDS